MNSQRTTNAKSDFRLSFKINTYVVNIFVVRDPHGSGDRRFCRSKKTAHVLPKDLNISDL